MKGFLIVGLMSKTYELELKIILTDEQQHKVVECARRI
jgi:hypothetical protein